MRRIKFIILVLLCTILLPTGCLGSLGVADGAYVLSVGFARGDTFAYRVSVLCALPEGGKDEGATLHTEVFSAEARTLFEAIETLNAGLPLRLSFARASLLLVAEPLLQEGRLQELLDFSLGALDIASDVRVMAARGDMAKLLGGLVSEADPAFSKTIANIDRLDTLSGTVIDARCRTVREAFGSGTFDLVLPLVGWNEPTIQTDLIGGEAYPHLGGALLQQSGLPVSLAGSAVFSETRMVGVLSGRHTALVGMVRGDFRVGRLTWARDGQMLSVRLRRRKAPRIRTADGSISVTVYLDAAPEYPLMQLPPRTELTSFLTAQIEAELYETLAALQAANADAMALGTHDILRFAHGGGGDWKARYPHTAVSFTVELIVKGEEETA